VVFNGEDPKTEVRRGRHIARQVEDELDREPEGMPLNLEAKWDNIISSGSTLLDLAISGGRLDYGGIPAGIIMEIHGPTGVGKTALAVEIAVSCQLRGGQVKILDPEARLDKQYAQLYGLSLAAHNFEYKQPSLVADMFDEEIGPWEPTDAEACNVIVADSLAALSTEMEMENGDKWGMRRAKEFSAAMRKYARIINQKGWLIVCTNQMRTGDKGDFTPGGKALEFYPSLRIKLGYDTRKGKKKFLKKAGTVRGKKSEKTIGINGMAHIVKSSLDDPYRYAPLAIVFRYGIHDIIANLQYIKDMTVDSTYKTPDEKSFIGIIQAAQYIGKHNQADELKEMVVELWKEIESELSVDFTPKSRI